MERRPFPQDEGIKISNLATTNNQLLVVGDILPDQVGKDLSTTKLASEGFPKVRRCALSYSTSCGGQVHRGLPVRRRDGRNLRWEQDKADKALKTIPDYIDT